jgi:hypothetical protein
LNFGRISHQNTRVIMTADELAEAPARGINCRRDIFFRGDVAGPTVRPADDQLSCATVSAPSFLRSVTTTAEPAIANIRASPRPIAAAAPVTTVTSQSSLNLAVIVINRYYRC